MSTPRMTEQEWAEHQRRMRISKSKTGVRSGGVSRSQRPAIDCQSTGIPERNQAVEKRAGAIPASSPYKSKWEAAYAAKLELEKRAGIISAYWYEPFSLWLPGNVRYKPDFLVEKANPRFVVSVDMTMPTILEVIEVKGWSRNLRDGMTRLKIAAALFPCFRWTLARKTKDGWEEEQP